MASNPDAAAARESASGRSLRPLSRGRLYEQIAARLREMIDVEGLRVGDRLMSERELAEHLGVSRNSVRQAMTALEVSGLVEVRHGGGVFVAQAPDAVLSSLASELEQGHADLPAIMELREAIEAQTARLAARRRSEDDLQAMRDALAAMEDAVNAGTDPASADAAFHEAVVRTAGNRLLLHVWNELAESIDRTRRASLARPGRPPRSLANHREILDAIEQRDDDRAARSMLDHLSAVADLGFLTEVAHVMASDR